MFVTDQIYMKMQTKNQKQTTEILYMVTNPFCQFAVWRRREDEDDDDDDPFNGWSLEENTQKQLQNQPPFCENFCGSHKQHSWEPPQSHPLLWPWTPGNRRPRSHRASQRDSSGTRRSGRPSLNRSGFGRQSHQISWPWPAFSSWFWNQTEH